MDSPRPPLFRKRQFEPAIIVTCVRWYLRFSLSLRDLEELMAERGLVGRSHHGLALGPGIRPRDPEAIAETFEVQTRYMVHGRNVRARVGSLDVFVPSRRRSRPNRRLLSL